MSTLGAGVGAVVIAVPAGVVVVLGAVVIDAMASHWKPSNAAVSEHMQITLMITSSAATFVAAAAYKTAIATAAESFIEFLADN